MENLPTSHSLLIMPATQTAVTEFFAVVRHLVGRCVPQAPARAPTRAPRNQSLLSQYFPNEGMYIGEIGSTRHLDRRRLAREHQEHLRIAEVLTKRELMPPTFPPARIPETAVKLPLPFDQPTTAIEYKANYKVAATQAAAAAEPFLNACYEYLNSQEFREAILADPDFFSRHVSEADRAFTATLGPRARAYVDGPDNGLQFRVFHDGRMIPLGPGFAALSAAMAADDAAVDSDNDSVNDSVPLTSDNIFDTIDASSDVSDTSLETLSSHSSIPPLEDMSDHDNSSAASRPPSPPPVLTEADLALRLRRRLEQSALGDGEHYEPMISRL
ncbi:hypothetical protein B0H15DRAFT_958198 [Mycena belliarum]|uniref:Uncharacterized protein n=1 Tax=Mycena belliarum TaxID=1033014 RepID=A0AAD6XKU1_9AGAR|nr:hypothetical protein B0H15DRAFT_958198 [Mycena belliae]